MVLAGGACGFVDRVAADAFEVTGMATVALDISVQALGIASDVFRETERRLNDWGMACRRESHARGRSFTSLADSAEYLREQERKRRGVRRRALRLKKRAAAEGGPPLDTKEAAEERGFIDRELTAKGKQLYSMHALKVHFSAAVAQVDEIIRGMPGWMQKPIHRTYRYTPQQPFRIAAGELRMDEDHYRSQWRAAVKYVAAKLAQRSEAKVK
jgi:hypothetical protein